MTELATADLDGVLARAENLRSGPPAPQTSFVAVAQELMRLRRWLDAADLWEMARSGRSQGRTERIDGLSIAQQALCVSKERVKLSLDDAFSRAVAILESGGLKSTKDQETLGIAGGIYKRYWDAFRQSEHLQQSFAYYMRGWEAQGVADNGYTGINAAYVADVIAHVEETVAKRSGASSPTSAKAHRTLAQGIRNRVVAAAPELVAAAEERAGQAPSAPAERPWWILVTLAEAHFGLAPDDASHYAPANEYLRHAIALPAVPDWMLETTARQLGALARMQEVKDQGGDIADSRPWQVLDVLIERVPGLRTEVGAKVGLALSGGGFRASLFHIGVLARLAEQDMLRHVEVISCVSGGSVLGAVYYLELRKLLQAKRDDEITKEDYTGVVQTLQRSFLRGIQHNNFRMRMLERFSANVAMLRNKASRTEALGRVMGRELCGSDSVHMDEIRIAPPDGEPGFESADYNWRRRNKVPLLLLNATNQAGGHSWEFTPYEMGEPPLPWADSNPRTARRPYGQDRVHIWRAVSASACVPALFEPIRVNVRGDHVDLLDGGVHDNQGTSGLLGRDCTLLLVSDASGQLAQNPGASTSFVAVGLRADEIVQERLRIALYEALEARRRGSLLRGMMFLHLRLGLGETDGELTSYGISTGVQRRLAAIRTDLDVFHDAEAMSLMASGYQMAGDQFGKQLPQVVTPAATSENWEFLALLDQVAHPSGPLLSLLDTSGQRLLKVWRAVPRLKWMGRALLAAAACGTLLLLVNLWRSTSVIQLSSIPKAILISLVAWGLSRVLQVQVPSWKRELAFTCLAFSGAALAWLHRRYLDPAYLRAGSRERLGVGGVTSLHNQE
jgi:predicted acylesterase/phospholipase RssA